MENRSEMPTIEEMRKDIMYRWYKHTIKILESGDLSDMDKHQLLKDVSCTFGISCERLSNN